MKKYSETYQQQIDEGIFDFFKKLFAGTKSAVNAFKSIPQKAIEGWKAEAQKLSEDDVNKKIDELVNAANKAGKKVDKNSIIDLINKADPTDKTSMTNLSTNFKLGNDDKSILSLSNLIGQIQQVRDEIKKNLQITAPEYKGTKQNSNEISVEGPDAVKAGVADAFKKHEKELTALTKSFKSTNQDLANAVAKVTESDSNLQSAKEGLPYYGISLLIAGNNMLNGAVDAKTVEAYLNAYVNYEEK